MFPPSGLFHDIVMAPDRERLPEANPVVSFRTDDEGPFLTEVERRSLGRYELARRGVWHGNVAELKPDGLVGPRLRRRRRAAMQVERWVAARPIALPLVADALRPALVSVDVDALAEELGRPSGLREVLARRSAQLAPEFVLRDETPALFDPERDVARVLVDHAEADLWLKASRLSTHPEDRSVRVRVSFGSEGDDDASHDEVRHSLVGELARRALPGAAALAGLAPLRELLEHLSGGPVFYSQHIAYLNAPGGGARFHHDAFDEAAEGAQLGVAYCQLVGRTVWLALSIEDLGARVREFLGALEGGEAPWLAEELGGRLATLRALAQDRSSLLGELAQPGCGVLGPVVDRGPEFTGFLADAGHAVVLRPGDVLILPNHGLQRTAMHSVFCGSERSTYALSVAIRRVTV